MNIADKLIRAKADLDAVYAAGGRGLFKYAAEPSRLFFDVDFGGQDEIIIEMPNVVSVNINEMFGRARGYKKLTALFRTDVAYNGYRFIYGLSTGGSTIEELTILDGMKFSRLEGFAQYCTKLKTINGRFDLSACTTVAQCFLSCAALEDISFVPGSIKISINLAQSYKLTDSSIRSIIEGLADLTGQTAQSLTLHTDVKNKLTPGQMEAIALKNWDVN